VSDNERGPLRSYEIIWHSGHVETIQAHQVSWPNNSAAVLFGAQLPRIIHFHGEIDGRWTLVLHADEAEIRTIRDVTADERIAP
jgi:hypothetical protein